MFLSDLNNDWKDDITERLEELIQDFIAYAEYIPNAEDRTKILEQLCGDISESLNKWEPEPYGPQKKLIADDVLKTAFDSIVAWSVAAPKEDDIELPTFIDTPQ